MTSLKVGDKVRLTGTAWVEDYGVEEEVVEITSISCSGEGEFWSGGYSWVVPTESPAEGGEGWEFVNTDELPFEEKVNEVLADVKAGPVNPAHYKGFSRGSEVIDITENLNFNRGSAVKYLARAGVKDASTELEDLHKALWYVTREIARLTLPE